MGEVTRNRVSFCEDSFPEGKAVLVTSSEVDPLPVGRGSSSVGSEVNKSGANRSVSTGGDPVPEGGVTQPVIGSSINVYPLPEGKAAAVSSGSGDENSLPDRGVCRPVVPEYSSAGSGQSV